MPSRYGLPVVDHVLPARSTTGLPFLSWTALPVLPKFQ